MIGGSLGRKENGVFRIDGSRKYLSLLGGPLCERGSGGTGISVSETVARVASPMTDRKGVWQAEQSSMFLSSQQEVAKSFSVG